jgi:A/G-specific adenine glycosylase
MRNPSAAEAAQLRTRLLLWYRKEGRPLPWRRVRSPLYMRVVSELLLQRTRAESVASIFPRFVRRYPSWRALSRAKKSDLAAILRPLGLWRRRAVALLALARTLEKRCGHLPATRDEIEALPGVGQYIANAILLFAHDRREPLIDVNMARVLERIFGPRRLVDIRYDPQLQRIARIVVDHRQAARINWAILDLAALICRRANPLCARCPLVSVCDWGDRHAKASMQVAKSAKSLPVPCSP